MTTKEPQRLGRGLAALMGETASTSSMEGVQSLGIELLVPGPFQPRQTMAPEALDELTTSIRARGVLQPLLARPEPGHSGRYQIIAGERRWRAAQRAGLHEVPVLVRILSDLDALAASLVENLQRQDLNAIEEAEGFRRLIEEFHLTQETVAQAVGKSRSHVANTIRLLNLPASAITALRDGAITAGHARALLSFADPQAALRMVIDRGLNVRQTEALTTAPDRSSNDQRGRAGAIEDPDTRALERELTDKIGLKVELVSRGQSGTVKIHYRTMDQLDALIVSLSR